jgi:hypothetical protein
MVGNALELQDFTPVLKNYYLPYRKSVFPVNTVLLAQARKFGADKVEYAGNDLFFDVKVDRRGGFVSSARGFFPAPKNAREKQGRLSVARMYARVGVDGLALKATENSKGSYISAAKKIVDDVMEQWDIEQERVLHGDSLGIRAVVDTVTDTTHIIVSAPYGITGAGPGNLHLVDGDTISVRSSTGATHRGKAVLSTTTPISLSGDSATLTLSTAIAGMQVGDLVFTGVPTATDTTDDSFGAEPHGIKSIVDVEGSFATFEGINDTRWAAQKLTSSTIDETIVMKLLNVIRARSGVDTRKDPKAMLLLTTTGIWQTYGESLLGLRRFAAPTMELEGGFTATKVANAALVDDPWGPRGRLYAIHGPDTVFIDLMDFGKIGYQDSPKWRPAVNQDGYDAIFASYWNYGALVRNSHGVISGITDTVNYSPVG